MKKSEETISATTYNADIALTEKIDLTIRDKLKERRKFSLVYLHSKRVHVLLFTDYMKKYEKVKEFLSVDLQEFFVLL